MNQYFDENALDNVTASKLASKGIDHTSDNLQDIDGQNVIIDTSEYEYETDSKYMNSLIRLAKASEGYSKKILYIPAYKWFRLDVNLEEKSKTPLGCICRYIKQNPAEFKNKFKGFILIFFNDRGQCFPLYVDQYKSSDYNKVVKLLREILERSIIPDKRPEDIDVKSPVKAVVDKKELESKQVEDEKQELVDAIAQAAENAESEEELWENIDNDEQIKRIVADLENEDDGAPKFNAARTSRIAKLNDEFLNKELNGKTIEDIINTPMDNIPSEHLKVSSINDDWKDVSFINFGKSYDINKDIMNILYSLSEKSYPISILDVSIKDTSTNLDYIDTYTVKTEDGFGKRSTLKFDIPKFRNNRFMRLGGNDKTISGQLVLLPCIKTEVDAVQCISNYNKIFIYRHGQQGRSLPTTDRLLKTVKKLNGGTSKIKIIPGDNSSICSKHELPIDYIDIASFITRIETKECVYYFNQDVYYRNYTVDIKKGIPYAVNRSDGSLRYYKDNNSESISDIITSELCNLDADFNDVYTATKAVARLNYSEASIMSNRIPLIVVMGYTLGLKPILEKYINTDNTIKYSIVEGSTRVPKDKSNISVIKFNDGYITYDNNYSSSLLLNGLSVCPTESYSITDINSKDMWLDFLDEFGGRRLADGLDNFADMFIDPITKEVCEHCKIPSNYFDMLMYANNLLADNKYNKHTDISGNRYRANELIAGYFYKAISQAYGEYKIQVKRGRDVGISMKQSAVIDLIMQDPVFSDLSYLNPLLEIEASHAVSFKGLSGMNSARSYSLDKRTYDDSMTNKLALSTGFAANVGINRQTTIDMDVEGQRGYIKDTGKEEMSDAKTLSMTEAITPFGSTRDDPFRTAMTFIQTSEHSMRTKVSMPLLITNGADEAMPYYSSDEYAFKAKDDGEVVEIVPNDHMIIKYKNPIQKEDGTTYIHECIDLRETVKKNSAGGFYLILKLDTDLKVGSKFKSQDVIAYDTMSYSNRNGETDHLAYNPGILAKVAILNTEDGFEDSTSVSNWMSEAMATDVVVQKEVDLSKNTNVYNMLKAGDAVQEGDPLIIFQNSFDEEDANALLKTITDSEFVSDLGRIRLKSKYTGLIQDIKIYRTCEIDEMSDSLKKIVTAYEKNIKARKKMYQDYEMPDSNILDPDYKLPPTGIMKNNRDGVKIVFSIKYNDKLSIGDKTVAQSANKGVVRDIFPKGREPFSEFRPEESIHALFAASSFNSRMVTSVWSSGAINKCMIELDRAVKDIMGIPNIPIELTGGSIDDE